MDVMKCIQCKLRDENIGNLCTECCQYYVELYYQMYPQPESEKPQQTVHDTHRDQTDNALPTSPELSVSLINFTTDHDARLVSQQALFETTETVTVSLNPSDNQPGSLSRTESHSPDENYQADDTSFSAAHDTNQEGSPTAQSAIRQVYRKDRTLVRDSVDEPEPAIVDSSSEDFHEGSIVSTATENPTIDNQLQLYHYNDEHLLGCHSRLYVAPDFGTIELPIDGIDLDIGVLSDPMIEFHDLRLPISKLNEIAQWAREYSDYFIERNGYLKLFGSHLETIVGPQNFREWEAILKLATDRSHKTIIRLCKWIVNTRTVIMAPYMADCTRRGTVSTSWFSHTADCARSSDLHKNCLAVENTFVAYLRQEEESLQMYDLTTENKCWSDLERLKRQHRHGQQMITARINSANHYPSGVKRTFFQSSLVFISLTMVQVDEIFHFKPVHDFSYSDLKGRFEDVQKTARQLWVEEASSHARNEVAILAFMTHT